MIAVARTIDASVVGFVMFEGQYTAEADRVVTSDRSMIAPSLIDAELLSIATGRVRTGRVDADRARARWRMAARLPIRRVSVRRYAEAAFELSARLPHPSADCVYLAVALAEVAPLVTADESLLKRARDAGLGDYVVWIEDAG